MSLLLVPRDLEGLAERQPARAKDGGIYLLGRRKTALYLQCHKNMLLREEICTEAARGSRLETPQFSQHRTHLPVLFLKRLHTHTVRIVETVVIWHPPPPPPISSHQGTTAAGAFSFSIVDSQQNFSASFRHSLWGSPSPPAPPQPGLPPSRWTHRLPTLFYCSGELWLPAT